MRVLITRPESRAGKTVAKLEELGHEVARLPLSTPIHDRAAAETAVATPHASIAVTSAEAVRGLAELGFALAPHLGTKVFAVGKATAFAARAAGFTTLSLGRRVLRADTAALVAIAFCQQRWGDG